MVTSGRIGSGRLQRSVKDLNPNAFCVPKKYHYEPLPRKGLSHPFVQAILSEWLGPDSNSDAVAWGLQSLRTWRQHRRSGENKTSRKKIHTDQMTVVVNNYAHKFLALAHCFIVRDNAQQPRKLFVKLKQLQKQHPGKSKDYFLGSKAVFTDNSECVPDGIRLSDSVKNVSCIANHAVFHENKVSNSMAPGELSKLKKTPLIFYNKVYGKAAILLELEGIVCARCVKIVEAVLKGCQRDRSPISGLLDAVADQELNTVLIKIDHPSNAQHIASETARTFRQWDLRPRSKKSP
jgi:hypothetical protein